MDTDESGWTRRTGVKAERDLAVGQGGRKIELGNKGNEEMAEPWPGRIIEDGR
jgi:hypothetical protein